MSQEVHNRMAQFAFSSIQTIGNTNREFRSLARSMPSMIQVNGLGAGVAFLCAKKKRANAHERMYKLLNEWLKERGYLKPGKQADLMESIVNLDSSTYRLYTNECMNLCLWVKRFAEGMIENEVE